MAMIIGSTRTLGANVKPHAPSGFSDADLGVIRDNTVP
jgi:hypothetical protein